MHVLNDRALLLLTCSRRIGKKSVEETFQFVTECVKKVLFSRRETFDEDTVQEIVNDFFA